MSTPSIQNNPLIGIWKLISAIAIQPDGTINSEVYGTHPLATSLTHYDGNVFQNDRPPLSQEVRSPLSPEMQSLPIEELAQAFTTFNAYAGTYTLSGNTVTHQIEIASIPNRVQCTVSSLL